MSLSLGILLATSVAVDLSALDAAARARLDVDRLHGQLLVRLAEEGYGVRASGPTSYRLELRMSDERVVLRAVGAEARSELVAVGPRPVLHLEVIQLALFLLHEVPPGPASPARLPTVFVGFPARADEEAANRLYGRVAVMVVEDGYELVGTPARAERLVCISPAGDPVWRAAGDDAGCDQAVTRPPSQSSLQSIAGAVGELLKSAPGTEPARSPPGVELERRDAAPERPGWTLGMAAGALRRGDEVDPSVAMTLRLGPRNGFCASATARYTAASTARLGARETVAAAGPGLRMSGGPVTFEVSVLAGLFVHRFQRSEGAAFSRSDWIVLAPLDLSLRLTPPWRLHVATLLGLAQEPQMQLVEGEDPWSRGTRQLAFEAGLSVDF